MDKQMIYARQTGASFFATLFVVLSVGFFLTVAFKLFTPYWDHKTISSVVKATSEDREELARPLAQIRTNINRKFQINQVSLPDRDALKITDQAGILTFHLQYEVRVPMFFNVDAVVKFEETYEGRRP